MKAAFETRTCTAGNYSCLSDSDSCEPLGSQIWGRDLGTCFYNSLALRSPVSRKFWVSWCPYSMSSDRSVWELGTSGPHPAATGSWNSWTATPQASPGDSGEGCHCTVKEASDHSDLPGEPDLGVITGPRCCCTDERESYVKHRNPQWDPWICHNALSHSTQDTCAQVEFRGYQPPFWALYYRVKPPLHPFLHKSWI